MSLFVCVGVCLCYLGGLFKRRDQCLRLVDRQRCLDASVHYIRVVGLRPSEGRRPSAQHLIQKHPVVRALTLEHARQNAAEEAKARIEELVVREQLPRRDA